MAKLRLLGAIPALGLLLQATASAAPGATALCEARSHALAPLVVELYTSEGCNSCPPADRWLSQLVAAPAASAASNAQSAAPVIALAFHVDYWDYLGWRDAFAQPAFAQRQSLLARRGGASGVYTPQVFVNGRDEPGWRRSSALSAAPAGTRASVRFGATAQASAAGIALAGKFDAPAGAVRLRYALTENGLSTVVRAGENRGETLRHDAVVRSHGSVAPDAAGAFATTLPWPSAAKPGASRLHLIAEDAAGRALAAATLSCLPG